MFNAIRRTPDLTTERRVLVALVLLSWAVAPRILATVLQIAA